MSNVNATLWTALLGIRYQIVVHNEPTDGPVVSGCIANAVSLGANKTQISCVLQHAANYLRRRGQRTDEQFQEYVGSCMPWIPAANGTDELKPYVEYPRRRRLLKSAF